MTFTAPLNPLRLIIGLIALAMATACGGGDAQAPSSLSYPTPPAAYVVGTAISPLSPTVTGTVDSYSISPTLPAGLSISATTGQISGTPTAVAASAVHTVTATNQTGSTTATLTLQVNPPAPTGLSYASPQVYTAGTAIAALPPTVTGVVASYAVAPALPAGLTLNTTSGQITGTPTTATAQATYRVTASNVTGSTGFDLVVTVNAAPPTALSYASPQVYAVGTAIAPLNPTVTGIATTYSVVPNLPAGLTLNATTGQISGTPTAATAQATYTVTAANASGSTTFGLVITVGTTASGATIIFSRDNGSLNTANLDLYAVRESGGAPIQLTDAAGSEWICGVTPSGRVIYQRATSNNGVDIYSVAKDGTDTRALAISADDETCVHIVGSGPASGRVVYRRSAGGSSRDLYAVNEDGTLARTLANGPLDEDFAGITNNGIVIYETSPFQNRDIYAVDLEGLTNIPLATSARFEVVAGIVGSTVIYGLDNFGQSDLYSVSSVGNGGSPIAADPNTEETLAGITPNGTLIIHKQPNLSGNRDIYAGNIALATSSDFEIYSGSAANGRVVYQRSSRGSYDVFSVLADGTGTVALADSADDEGLVFITADNRAFINRYAITGPTVTLGDVYLIGLDGSNLTPIATSVHQETFAALIGGTVLYRRETVNSVNDIQLWAVTTNGTGNFRLFTGGGQAHFVAATPSGRVLVNNYTGIPNLYVVNTNGSDQRLLAANATFVALIP